MSNRATAPTTERTEEAVGHVVWLGEPACHERALVGGKAASLSRLAARFPIPPGFALTTSAFDLACAGLPSTPDEISVPSSLADEIAAAYRLLSERCETAAVAVRSSAVDEDSAAASFAGQHQTCLNITGLDGLLNAIEVCWSSFWSSAATDYRRNRGLTVDRRRVAVLVQQLVLADVSAIAFTADPVSGGRGQVMINATWGLGESLVGGAVVPDNYSVRKADHAVSPRWIADKRRMTVAVAGGTSEVGVPSFLRSRSSLSEDEQITIARLGMALEQALGEPVDIECAYRGGRLHLLQCRPITT